MTEVCVVRLVLCATQVDVVAELKKKEGSIKQQINLVIIGGLWRVGGWGLACSSEVGKGGEGRREEAGERRGREVRKGREVGRVNLELGG